MKCGRCQADVPMKFLKELISFKDKYTCPNCGAKVTIDYPWGYLFDLAVLVVVAVIGIGIALHFVQDFIAVFVIAMVIVTVIYAFMAAKVRQLANSIVIEDEIGTPRENLAGKTCPKCGGDISKWNYTRCFGNRAKCKNCKTVLKYDMPFKAIVFLYIVGFLLVVPAGVVMVLFCTEDPLFYGSISILYLIVCFFAGAHWEARFVRKRFPLIIHKET